MVGQKAHISNICMLLSVTSFRYQTSIGDSLCELSKVTVSAVEVPENLSADSRHSKVAVVANEYIACFDDLESYVLGFTRRTGQLEML